MLGSEGFSAEDLKALRSSLSASSPLDELSDAEADAKFRAQEAAFEAVEARSGAAARKLAKRALRLDPHCVEALLILGDLELTCSPFSHPLITGVSQF
jgi:hypothetical protein